MEKKKEKKKVLQIDCETFCIDTEEIIYII